MFARQRSSSARTQASNHGIARCPRIDAASDLPPPHTLLMRKDPSIPAGTVHRLTLDSQVLAGNLLGDPTRRVVDVYVPHGHDGRGLPLLVDVVGFTAGGPVHTNWKNFGENLPERLDRLIAEGQLPPVVVAF